MLARYQRRGLLAAVLTLICGTAGAAGLQVAPIGLEFQASDSAQGLWLTNTGSETLDAQVRVFDWAQENGEDELTPTRALVASPPMLSLAPGARQLVRVIRPGALTPGTDEAAYRLLVDELPGNEEGEQTGVRYVLRYSIPVFVKPANPPEAGAIAQALDWSLAHSDNGFTLQAHNDGALHAQLSQVSLLPPDGAPIEVSAGLLGYVLPGATMHWPLKLDTARLSPGTRLKVSVNGKPVDQDLRVSDLSR